MGHEKGFIPMETKTIRDQEYFLKSLREDGVEEIYVARAKQTAAGKKSAVSVPPEVPQEARTAQPSVSQTGPRSVRDELIELRDKVLACSRCTELALTRKTVVFGAGNASAKLMFVGEAPGHDEDVQGLPFVGKAGQLLTKIIESIGYTRKQVFICNVLKCRPPQNRTPQSDEIMNCHDYLMKQIALIHPQIICALGTFAAQTILKTGQSISHLRGKFYDFPGSVPPDGQPIKVICTFHPAYLLRNPQDKRKVWEDMKMIQKELEGK